MVTKEAQEAGFLPADEGVMVHIIGLESLQDFHPVIRVCCCLY